MPKAHSKVMIIDDHPLVREWLATLLSHQENLHVCGEAEDQEEALKAIGTLKPDVAIVDITLKSGSGLELIKAAKLLDPNLAIIVLSMHDEMTHAERAVRAGASGYVMKTQSAQNIVTAIREVLRGNIYLSDRMTALCAARFLNRKVPGTESPVTLLSDRELEVFSLFGQGCETKQVAKRLEISPKTVHAYCGRIKEKLNLTSTAQLLVEAVRWTEAPSERGIGPGAASRRALPR
jgi:DNA-binding NarL/FixJ family response regulator